MDLEKPEEITEESVESQVSTVPPYRVILHNDEETPMDFVVLVLIRFFVSDRKKASDIMHEAHSKGQALVAIMPLEHAEFKVDMAHELVRANAFPLTFSIEPCD